MSEVENVESELDSGCETSDKLDISGDGGVLKELLKAGIGEETPSNGCRISLHYTGKLLDGTVFDSSHKRGEPFEFTLGKGRFTFNPSPSRSVILPQPCLWILL